MKKLALLLTLAFYAFPLIAQQNLSPELIWQMGRVGDAHLSPDGNWIVYSVRTPNLKENKSTTSIYLMNSSGMNPKLIAGPADSASGPFWRPDGKKIAYYSTQGGEHQLWEMEMNGTMKIKISSIKGGMDNVKYAPDMKHVLFTQDVQIDNLRPEKLFHDLDKTSGRIFDGLMYRHWDTWSDGSYTHVFYANYSDAKVSSEAIDIMSNEPYDAPVKPMGGEDQLAWSPDGKWIAYTSRKLTGTAYANSTNSDIYLYDLATGKTNNITSDNLGYDQDPQFSPDGSKLVYHSMKTPGFEADKNRLMCYDFKTKTAKDLTANIDITTEGFSWTADGNMIYFISPYQGANQIFCYSFKTNNFKQITKDWHDYNAIEVGVKGKQNYILGSRVDFSNPTELFSVDDRGIETQITFVNKDLHNSISWGKVEKRMVKTYDGKDMLVWVIYPPGFDKSKKYPTLLYCQGGPQGMVSQFWSARWNFQLMAANGYIVVAPNRRGLPGFGQAWNDEISGDYGGACMKDYLSAIDDVSKESYVNKDKMGCVGASFGGYSVYYLAGHHEKRFKAFIAHCGMFNVTSWYGTTEEQWFANFDQRGSYWQNPENYAKFSPHNFVKNWDAPILVIHNEKDFRVPLGQGMEAFTAAQQMNIPSRFLYFPDENHWVSKPQNSVLWHRVFYDWLDKYLK